jgi:hypothetical protein
MGRIDGANTQRFNFISRRVERRSIRLLMVNSYAAPFGWSMRLTSKNITEAHKSLLFTRGLHGKDQPLRLRRLDSCVILNPAFPPRSTLVRRVDGRAKVAWGIWRPGQGLLAGTRQKVPLVAKKSVTSQP